ncbi:MAG TPA: hypothetical protein VFV87_19485 [Pirellulaceae bacterium]|nr:hypothetical protein [Pirellulaceae bacterium]
MSQRTRMCVICKKLIEPERAAAMASTNLCTEHGEAIERFGGEFRVQSQGENLSKPGSLKRNPGGVKTRMVRNLRALDQLREECEKQKQGA